MELTVKTFGYVVGGYITIEAAREVIKIGVRRVWGRGRSEPDDRRHEQHNRVHNDTCRECKNGINSRIGGVEDWTGKVEVKLDTYMRERATADGLMLKELGVIQGQLKRVLNGTK